MARQGQQGGEQQSKRDRESNLGQSAKNPNRPAGTTGQQPNRGNQQNHDEDDSGIGNRPTNR